MLKKPGHEVISASHELKIPVEHLCWESSLVFGKCARHCVAIGPPNIRFFIGWNLPLTTNLHNGSHDLRQRSGIWWKSSVDLGRFDVGASAQPQWRLWLWFVERFEAGHQILEILETVDPTAEGVDSARCRAPKGALRRYGRNEWPFDGLFTTPLVFRCTGQAVAVLRFQSSDSTHWDIAHTRLRQSRPQGAWLHGRPHLVLGDGRISPSAAGIPGELPGDSTNVCWDAGLYWFRSTSHNLPILSSQSSPFAPHGRPKIRTILKAFAMRWLVCRMHTGGKQVRQFGGPYGEGRRKWWVKMNSLGSWNFQDVKHIQLLLSGTLI